MSVNAISNNWKITNQYMDAIASKECDLSSIAAKVSLVVFPVFMLITFFTCLADLFSGNFNNVESFTSFETRIAQLVPQAGAAGIEATPLARNYSLNLGIEVSKIVDPTVRLSQTERATRLATLLTECRVKDIMATGVDILSSIGNPQAEALMQEVAKNFIAFGESTANNPNVKMAVMAVLEQKVPGFLATMGAMEQMFRAGAQAGEFDQLQA